MEIQVLGAGRDVGRSCLLLKTATSRILLDCGAHPGFADEQRFPDFSTIPNLSSLDAILITHFHLDHAASLPYLTETLQCTAPVYMTKPTKDLSRLMLLDFVSTSAARKQFCPFGAAEVDACLARVRFLDLDDTVMIADKIQVKSYYAGHALGAVMLLVSVDGVSVLYSGDYSTRADRHLKAATVPYGLCPDLFITEATYCNQIRKEGRMEQEDELMNAVTQAALNGGKVLVPISAFGRVQAVCATFESHPDCDVLRNIPMYIVAGLASKANDVYEQFSQWTVQPHTEGIDASDDKLEGGELRHNLRASSSPFLSKLKSFNKNEHWNLLQARGPVILFATPGTMSTGLSREVFRLWAADPKNVVVVPGFAFSNTLASKLLSGRNVDSEVETEVKCRLVNMAFNSHTDARGIARMCRRVMPNSVMLVHGDGPKILEFQKTLTTHLGIKCFAPSNGDTVKVQVESRIEGAQPSSSPKSAKPQVSPEWQKLIDAYISGVRTRVGNNALTR